MVFNCALGCMDVLYNCNYIKMIYDFSKESDINKARKYFYVLIGRKILVEMRNITKRTTSQNSYLHALFALYGIEVGSTIEEAKTDIKRALGYVYEKNGKKYLHRTSKMTTSELSTFIDKFRTFASNEGCYLPSADEFNGKYADYQNEINKHKQYL